MVDTPSPYQGQERWPVTFAARHNVLRSYPSNPELQAAHTQMERGWTHIRPNSVLVAAMGNHWPAGSWQQVVDMVGHTQDNGVYCALSEIQDRCFNPYDALGTMRNEAIFTALGEGFQYLCYVDNDIHPEPDALLKLLRWQMPVVAPYIAEPGTGAKLFGPHTIEVNTGLQRAKWCVLSMVLFNLGVFRSTGPEFWRDAIGADEGYHFAKLSTHGIHLYIDSSLQLVVGGRPLYPLALNRLSSGAMRDVDQAARVVSAKLAGVLARRNVQLLEADQAEISGALTDFIRASKGDREIALQQRIERFVQPPDRRPIDPNSKWIKDGEYAPFIIKAEQAAAGAQTQPAPGPIPAPGSAPQSMAQFPANGIAKGLSFSGVGNG